MYNTMLDLVQDEPGIFGLLTALSDKIASDYSNNRNINEKRLSNKMRSYSYEIILKKTNKEIPSCCSEPIIGLYTYFLSSQLNITNVAEYKKNTELKTLVDKIRSIDFGMNKDNVYSVLKLLVGLKNSVKQDFGLELYKAPFSFGGFDKMLPRPPIADYGSPDPYPYFPSHVFELPFSLRKQALSMEHQVHCYTQYTVETFDSHSYLFENLSQNQAMDLHVFVSPMSLPSMTSTQLSIYSSPTVLDCGRITGPRDLVIPKEYDVKVVVSMPESDINQPVQEVYRAQNTTFDIWEIATQIDKNIPDDLWDIAAKLPPIRERQLISTSTREMNLWREIHGHELYNLAIISEKCFIRHVMYLLIGIETSSFPYNAETGFFKMKSDLVLEGVSKVHLRRYVSDLLLVGTYYKRLYNFAFNQSVEGHFHSNGLVYEAAREVIRRYLLEFRMKATEIFEDVCKEEAGYLPTLLQILYHIEPLKSQMETIVSIYKLIDPDSLNTLPHGAELMSYLFSEISLVTDENTSIIMHKALISVCKVYFKFIERFIFEGELLDEFHEFFIRKDNHFVHCKSKRYWDKGFHITQSVAVPEFLRNLAKLILLCGKSLRLLKLCNPSDPLILLISSDHPSVKCCASFSELERQQQILDVYRTRCLFVSGEPVTFDQILLKREAERKAFTEMASLKQTETMEKIVAERKRLAQLILAEKQHSLRILEAAMAEAKANKHKSRVRERKLQELERAEQKAREEVDSKLRDEEKNKIMEYYSELNMAVERSKLHTEWKIKRLQLDQCRMQLLSTEERNLKREKLELQIQKNEDEMSTSMQSLGAASDIYRHDDEEEKFMDNQDIESQISMESQITVKEIILSEYETNKDKGSKSTDVISAICNVAKTIFGVSQNSDTKDCDNEKELDAQGNILAAAVCQTEGSSYIDKFERYPDVFDNEKFLQTKREAVMNREKVLAHEFGSLDKENNEIISLLDEENNLKDPTNPFEEAKRNKMRVLGSETHSTIPVIKSFSEPRTEAQKEAILNKQKVLGVEFNLPAELYVSKEPANYAQEQACKNRIRMMTSENETRMKELTPKKHSKRSTLTLNLNSNSDPGVSHGFTPNTGAITPAEFFPRLDLETPTGDTVFDGGVGDVLTPKTDDKGSDSEKSKSDKDFVRTEGFNISLLVDEENVDGEIGYPSSETSPVRSMDTDSQVTTRSNYSIFNLLDGTYSLDNFDPFAVKSLGRFTRNYFNRQLDFEINNSFYTHPSVIMEEVKKKPYTNIFVTNCISEDKEDGATVDNIATLTASLQRSVMLPLTYQLEIVNNSILTHFLVNLDMYEHLRSLKDYFFLMDGEFSRSICNNLFTKLVHTLNPQELLNFATLHSILDKALGSSISHIHKFSENLSFTISEVPLSFHHSSPNVLQCLSLTYTVSWPLNIILSQEALARYAKVFQFLIKMRRISWVLREDFESLKLAAKLSKQHSRTLLRSPQYVSIQIYRHNMASLIRALDNYIVTTCILTSWTEFENDLKKARTLDDLYECHVVYIKKVLFRCLLNNRSTPIMKLLNDVFTVILKFSRVLKAGEWKQREPNGLFSHSNYAQLVEIYHLFEKLAIYIHKVITKLMECGYQRHLVELLTMVNLNHYYDADKKEDANASVQSP